MTADHVKNVLDALGIDPTKHTVVCNIANNHAGDRDDPKNDIDGIADTIAALESIGPHVKVIGTQDAEHGRVLKVTKGDVSAGFVGWTNLMNHNKKHAQKILFAGMIS